MYAVYKQINVGSRIPLKINYFMSKYLFAKLIIYLIKYFNNCFFIIFAKVIIKYKIFE